MFTIRPKSPSERARVSGPGRAVAAVSHLGCGPDPGRWTTSAHLGWRAMNAEHVKTRLHDALHRGSHKATEDELAEVAAVVLAIVGELTAEMAVIIGDLAERVERLEAKS
jgi:hypothetical protein